MSKAFRALAAGGLLLGLLGAGPATMAAEQGSTSGQGVTSGPAAGGNVTPSTATQQNKSVAAGAPGVAGQPGNKNGPPAKPPGQSSTGSNKTQ